MSRTKSLNSIESRITEVRSKVIKAKARYEDLCRELKDLIDERDEMQSREILKAIKSSGKSYKEVMTFLGK